MKDNNSLLKMIEDKEITTEEGLTENNKGEKMLYISAKSKDGEKVKVNIPTEFIEILGSTSFCNTELSKHNIDMNKIIEVVNSGLGGKIVEVDSQEGDKVIVEIS